MSLENMEVPDFPLQTYIHSFSVQDVNTVPLAISMFAKHGLLAIGEEHGNANLTGDLLYSLKYPRRGEIPIITAWTNNLGFISRNENYGIREYGISKELSTEEKYDISEEIRTLLGKYPRDNFLNTLAENLPYMSRLLPPNEFSWAIQVGQSETKMLGKIMEEIINGCSGINDAQLIINQKQILFDWLQENPQSILFNSTPQSEIILVNRIFSSLSDNLFYWELNELHFATSEQVSLSKKDRQASITRSLNRINNYHFLHNPQNITVMSNLLPIISLRTESIGLDIKFN